jgi:hypothetical protein
LRPRHHSRATSSWRAANQYLGVNIHEHQLDGKGRPIAVLPSGKVI